VARERRIGYLCAFAVLFVWAGFLLSSRLSQQQDFTPWDVAALRYAGAFVAALPFVAWLGLPRLPPVRTMAVVATAAFGFPLFAYHGFSFAPAAHGGVMLPGTLPFLTAALGAVLLAEAWTQRRVVSLAVVACGILLLASDTFGAHPDAWRGDLLFLAGSCCWATYTVLVRLWGVSAVTATLSAALWAAPVYLPVWWLLLPSNLAAVPAGPVAWQFIYQGVFAVLVAGFLFTRAVTAIGAPRTTTITSLVPAMAALAAWPLLGEPLGALGLVGVGLVSAGMVLGVLNPSRRAA
jgi:drug/metabolite transporter (DMT)-like permease